VRPAYRQAGFAVKKSTKVEANRNNILMKS
jgi:hypothetical protein